MNVSRVESVQLYEYTDGTRPTADRNTSTAPHQAVQTHHRHWSQYPARLTNRTLHPLWQARMQVHNDAWPWSEVLPVSELPGTQTRTAVRSPNTLRRGPGAPTQLPEGQGSLRRDIEYQSRTVTTQRNVVSKEHGYQGGQLIADRDCRFCNHRGKHASRPVRSRHGGRPGLGGKR